MFAQQDPEEQFQDPEEAPQVEEAPQPSAQQKEIQRIKNATRFSDNWNPDPFFKDQETWWPDTVRPVEEKYEMFDVQNDDQMAKFSIIKLSHKNKGHYKVLSEMNPQWDESRKTFLILLQYIRREFKTPFDSETNPSER